MAGLFDDLSIFFQIGDMFNAISQLPSLIGKMIQDPGLIVEMLKDMINGHMMRCNIVNPYGAGASDDIGWWNQRIVKKFWGEPDPEANGDAVIFTTACTVTSVIGYLVQQFIVGTGIAKLVGKLNDAGKFAEIASRMSSAGKALGNVVDKVKDVGKSIKGALRGTAEVVSQALEDIGIKFSDKFWGKFHRTAAKLGCSTCHNWAKICKPLMDKFDNLFANKLRHFKEGLLEHKYKKHAGEFGLDPKDLSKANLDMFENLAREAAEKGRKGVYKWQGKAQYGFLHYAPDGKPYFVAAGEAGDFVKIHKISSKEGFADTFFANLKGMNEFTR